MKLLYYLIFMIYRHTGHHKTIVMIHFVNFEIYTVISKEAHDVLFGYIPSKGR